MTLSYGKGAREEPWRKAAIDTDCACANNRKPCPYHEGWQDGHDAGTDDGSDATALRIRAQVVEALEEARDNPGYGAGPDYYAGMNAALDLAKQIL